MALYTSCKKDDDTITFPHDLFVSNVKAKLGIRIFTNKTEVKNAKLIDRFSKDINLTDFASRPFTDNDKITFLSKDTVVIYGQKYAVTQSEKLFLFYSSPYPLASKERTSFFNYQKYAAPIIAHPLGGYTSKEVRVGHGSFTKMDLPAISYLFKRGDAYQWTKQYGVIYNELEDGFVNSLGATDTLVIREFLISMKSR